MDPNSLFPDEQPWYENLPENPPVEETPPSPAEVEQQVEESQPVQQPVQEEKPPEPYQPDGVQQLVTQGLGAVDGVLGTDLSKRFAENQAKVPEVQKEWNENFEEMAYEGVGNTIGTEAIRATAGGVANAIEGTGETLDLLGDALGTATGVLRDEKDNPWSDKYEAADWNLGVTENKTGVGKFSRQMIGLLVGMRQAGRIPGLGGTKTTRVGRLVTEQAKGAIADFFITGNDENLSSMIQDSWLANPLSAALAVTDEDDPFSARIKNVVEGGILGTAVDGVGEVIGAFKKGQLWFQQTGDADEAAEVVMDALVEPAARATRDPAAANAAFDEWAAIARQQEQLPNGSSEWYALQEQLLKKQEDVPVGIRLQRTTYADDIIKVDGGKKEIEVNFVEELDDMVNVDGHKVVSIVWDTDENSLGTGALNSLKRYFNDAFSSMEPGTVVRNTPAPDDYAGNASAVQARKSAGASGQVDVEDFRELYISRGETPEEIEFLTKDWDGRSNISKESVLRDLDYDFRGDPGTPSKFLVDQFKVFKEKMDGQYPLTIGEGADGYTFRSVGEHFKGLTQKARDQVTGMKPPAAEYSNARSRLYQRAGFGPIVDDVHQYGIVRVDKRGTKWLEPVNTIDDFERAKEAALKAYSTPEPRPGAKARELDQVQKGSSPGNDPLFEPSDAPTRGTEYPADQVARSQARAEEFEQLFPVSASPALTDAAYEKIVSPLEAIGMTDEAIAGVKAVISQTASTMDIDKLAKEMGQSTEVTVAKALNAVRDFLELERLGDEDALRALDAVTFLDEKGRKIANREGVVATKTLIKDTAFQIQDLSTNIMDGAQTGADITAQVDKLVTRLKGLTRLHKTASVHYASGLQAFKNNALGGLSPGQLDKQIKEADSYLDKLVELARKGDPESIDEFKDMANGLLLSGGDATKQKKFFDLVRSVGMKDALALMYNSMLSSPLSHMRNILGNTITTTLRPLALAVGRGLDGDTRGAMAALGSFHALHENVWEALAVGYQTFKKGVPTNEGDKFVLQTKQAAEEIAQLKAAAKTDTERAFADYLEKQHNFLSNPWMQLPTRALSAADDAFKTLTARMEVRRMVFEDMAKDSKAFTGFKIDEELLAKKMSEAFDKKGGILDEKILAAAKENTFQNSLQGTMAEVDALVKSNPVATYFVPFVKTPHNIMVYGASFVPGVNRFLKEYKAAMNGTDEVAKSIMKGREALGMLTVTSALGMAMTDTITGNGPSDPEKRKLWLKTHQPNSIKIGGKWYSYKAIEPLNIIWSQVADTTKLLEAGADDAYERSVQEFGYALAANLTDKTYFQGLANLVAFMNPTELAKGDARLLQQIFYGGVNTFIPFSGARRQLASALDQDMYHYNNELERVLQTALPGAQLFRGQEKNDIFTGESLRRGDNDVLTNLVNNILPFNIRKVNQDPVLNELVEKGIDVRSAQGDALQGIELTAAEMSEIEKRVAATGLHSNLKRLMDSKIWKEDYERWSKAAPNNRGKIEQAFWYTQVLEQFQSSYQAARDGFAYDNPEFRQKVEDAEAEKYRANTGQYTQEEPTSWDIQSLYQKYK